MQKWEIIFKLVGYIDCQLVAWRVRSDINKRVFVVWFSAVQYVAYFRVL
jgi:hypothetical protein